MRKIRLKQVHLAEKKSVWRRDKLYKIHLYGGKILSFTTRKDLNYAMSEINCQLNAVFFELNEIWIQAFAEYRRLWFTFPNKSNVKSEERKLIDIISNLIRLFSLLDERSSWTNGNHFSFQHIYSIIDDLIKFNLILADIRNRNHSYCLERKVIYFRVQLLEKIISHLQSINVEPRYAAKKSESDLLKHQ